MKVYSTKEVSKLLGVKIGTLSRALFEDRIEPPQTIPGGRAYVWQVNDINKASWVMRHRDASDVFPKLNKTLKTYSIIGGSSDEKQTKSAP